MRGRCCEPPRLNAAEQRDGVRAFGPPQADATWLAVAFRREAARPSPLPVVAPDGTEDGMHTGARRHLALHLPHLATERRRLAGLAACWDKQGSRRLLTATSADAAAAGLYAGQPLADAQAIHPALQLVEATPAADAAWLAGLAVWALRITPLPAVDAPDGLVLDVTGLAHLHDGEAALRDAVVGRFARAGLTVRAALADSPAAAAALARAGVSAPGAATVARGIIVPPGGDRAAVAPLPLAALRLDPAIVAALSRLGLRRVGDVLRQPRGPLARRFGRDFMATLDAATGERSEPITPVRAPPELAVAQDFLEPIVTREAIDATLARLLARLCAKLEHAGQGARRLALLAFRVDGAVQEVAIGTGLPARDPRHFARLFRDKLETLEPGFGFDRLALEAPVAEPMAGTQAGLPGRDGVDGETRRQALAQLLDRLGQRLPVWRPAPRATHWPERAIGRATPFAPVTTPPGWPGPAARPVRLLRRPVALQAVALLPDAPPSLLRAGRTVWRVARAEGPERIEPEWWREARPDRPARDYYRVELTTGARLWVCRAGLPEAGAPARWWLHGRLP